MIKIKWNYLYRLSSSIPWTFSICCSTKDAMANSSSHKIHRNFLKKKKLNFECEYQFFKCLWPKIVNLWHLKWKHTHGLIKLFIAAMAYYINTPDSQSSGRGRCWPKYFKVGDLFWKIYTSLYANFQKKISSCGRSQTSPWFFM